MRKDLGVEEAAPSPRGATEIVAFLEEVGLRHLFGLPGSSMVSLLSELQDSEISFVPAVHESVAVAMADGYARVAGLGCAAVYMVPGVANSIGNLYNAWRDETPLLLLASQQAAVRRFGEATIGEADIAELARPFSRLAMEVPKGAPLRSRLRAAFRAATGPPSGPVFISLPDDVLRERVPVSVDRPFRRVPAGPPDVSAVADALNRSERPLFVVGGQLHRYGGARNLAVLAEQHKVPVVYESGWNDRLAIGPGHPNAIGRLTDAPCNTEQAKADVVVAIGCRHVLEAHPRSDPWFESARFVAHVNADLAKLEYPHSADWSSASDPAGFVISLQDALNRQTMDEALMERRQVRLDELAAARKGLPPSSYTPGVSALGDALERGWVVDESVSASGHLIRALQSFDGSRYLSTTGASLGWGTGAACGVAVASGEPVTCVLGDGALLFGVQGLWTAVAQGLPVTFVVFANGGYGSTRFFEREYLAEQGAEARSPAYLGSDLRGLGTEPGDVLRGFGIDSKSLSPGDDPRAAIIEAWEKSHKGPTAVVIPVDF